MHGLVGFLTRRPGTVLFSFSVMLLLAVLVTGRLRFQQDIFAVLPQNDKSFQVLRHIVTASEGRDTLYILVKSKQQTEDLPAAAEKLISDLRGVEIDGRKGFINVTALKNEAFSVDSFEKLLKLFLQKPHLFLTEKEFGELATFLNSPQAVDDELQRTLAFLSSPTGSKISNVIALDPLNVRPFLTEKLQKMQSGIGFAEGPYMLAPDKKALLLFTTPAFPVHEKNKVKRLFEEIDTIRQDHPELTIGLTGGYAMAFQEERLLRSDLLSAILGSGLGIALLFLVAYRRLLVLGFILVPLGVGLQLALGVMAIIWGEVHLIAVAFAAVVLGLGIDFAIHVYDRFVSEKQNGGDLESATIKAVSRTGKAVVVGGLTTLTAFSVLVLTGSVVVKQIGWLVTLGLLFCLVAILWALPAWLIWSDKFSWAKRPKPFRLLGMHRLGAMVGQHPKYMMLVSILLFLGSTFGLTKIGFEKDLMSLHPKELESIEVRRDIQESFGSGAKPLLVAWQAENSDDLWKTGKKIDAALGRLSKEKNVADWTSISTLSAGKALPVEINREVIGDAFSRYGLALETFDALPHFLDALSRPENLSLENCADFEQFPPFYNRFYICKQEKMDGIAWVYAKDGTADSLSRELAAIDQDILVISPESALTNLVGEAKGELFTTVCWAALLVIGIILCFFRRISHTLLALLPTILGLHTTMGVMGLLGVKINLINFIIIPILIGIGLDDGIHIIDRYKEQKDVAQTLSSTGRSILLTSLTTCLGFGSLALADYHILSSMGVITIVGVSACFFYSAVTLPSILQLAAKDA